MKDKKIDKDVKFQYNQSATIFIISLALTIMSRTTYHLIGGFTISWIFSLVQLALFAFSIVVIVKAFNDETYEIPVISNITKMIWK